MAKSRGSCDGSLFTQTNTYLILHIMSYACAAAAALPPSRTSADEIRWYCRDLQNQMYLRSQGTSRNQASKLSRSRSQKLGLWLNRPTVVCISADARAHHSYTHPHKN